jgi:hypothetical protein
MNQSTHTWMAIRAIALLEDCNEAPALVKILKPEVKSIAIGAWIPDLKDSKTGSGRIDNHCLKMLPYDGKDKAYFIVPKDKLLEKLGKGRMASEVISNDTTLNSKWWNTAYKGDPKPGQHLANRAMALSITLTDQLILGDSQVEKLVPGDISFIKNVNDKAKSSREQIATYFFMLSHFLADSCMPCHCDARGIHSYSNGLHKQLELHWSNKVGAFFKDDEIPNCNASCDEILNKSRQVDSSFKLSLPNKIPSLNSADVWKEVLYVCRASFTIANMMTPESRFPFDTEDKVKFKTLFSNGGSSMSLENLNTLVVHDSVMNIAMTWKHIWDKFTKKEGFKF